MLTLLAILHVVIGIGLVIFVLLQDPKGGGAGGMFGGGGGSNSVFGATGAGNFLTSTTKWFAIFFAVSCLALTCVATNNQRTDSVLDSGEITEEMPPPSNTGPIQENDADNAAPETAPPTLPPQQEAPAQ